MTHAPSAPPDVVVAGSICLDIIPTLAAAHAAQLVPGRVIEAEAATFATGGAVANTGMALHRLGAHVHLVARVGNDLFGQQVRHIIESQGCDTSGIIATPDGATAYTLVLSPPGTDRLLISTAGSNAAFRAADVGDSLLHTARLLHFGYPPALPGMYRADGAELVALLRRARASGISISLDLSMPDPHGASGRADWRAILAAVLPFVDICVPSIEELLLMLRPSLFAQLSAESGGVLAHLSPALVADLAREVMDMGAQVVALTLGHHGLYLRTAAADTLAQMGRACPANLHAWAARELWAPGYAVEVAGTTGAGDATAAGLLAAVLRGLPPEQALAAACAVGACSVEAADALSGVQSWPATTARMAAGWPRLPLALDMTGWQWHEPPGLWVGGACD
jgi:sugar/nucleoside kinase (ribokinase family)